jgi:hypothetical protein
MAGREPGAVARQPDLIGRRTIPPRTVTPKASFRNGSAGDSIAAERCITTRLRFARQQSWHVILEVRSGTHLYGTSSRRRSGSRSAPMHDPARSWALPKAHSRTIMCAIQSVRLQRTPRRSPAPASALPPRLPRRLLRRGRHAHLPHCSHRPHAPIAEIFQPENQ